MTKNAQLQVKIYNINFKSSSSAKKTQLYIKSSLLVQKVLIYIKKLNFNSKCSSFGQKNLTLPQKALSQIKKLNFNQKTSTITQNAQHLAKKAHHNIYKPNITSNSSTIAHMLLSAISFTLHTFWVVSNRNSVLINYFLSLYFSITRKVK